MNEISVFLKTSAVLKETPRRSGVPPWLVATTSTLSLAILIFFTLFPMAKGAGVETEAGAGSRTNTVAWSGVGKVIAE